MLAAVIRVTLVDPDAWEPLDLYFNILDTEIARKWVEHHTHLLSSTHSIRESSLKYTGFSLDSCLTKLTSIINDINVFYDQLIIVPAELNDDSLNYLHECYEIYGERIGKLLDNNYWDTAFESIAEDSPEAKTFPGETFNESMHDSFIELNEYIHQSEMVAARVGTQHDNIASDEFSEAGIITYSLNPRKDFPLTDIDNESFIKFTKFGDFCLGYNTLGKNLEHVILDNDQEAVDRNAIVPQTTWSDEVYVYLGQDNNNVNKYKSKWNSLQITEKLGLVFGEHIKNKEGYIKIGQMTKFSKDKFRITSEELTNASKYQVNFKKYTKVYNIEVVSEQVMNSIERTPRWKPIPKSTGKIVEKIKLGDNKIITWILNNICTYNCRYCPDMLHNGKNTKYDWQNIQPFLDSILEKYETCSFALSGGEPTLSTFFPELVRKINEKGSTVGITTNLSRSPRYIESHFKYLSYAACSFHPSMVFPKGHKDGFIEKAILASKHTYAPIRVMMDPEYWEEVIAFIDEIAIKCINNSVELVYIQDQYGSSKEKICELSYTPEQINFILTYKSSHKNAFPIHSLVDRSEGPMFTTKYINEPHQLMARKTAQEMINTGETRFFNYTCNIGKESLFINYDGRIRKANCNVGGTTFGTIETYKDIDWDQLMQPLICTQGYCPCGADVPISKFKNN